MVLGAVNAQAAWPENVNVSGDIIAELGVTTGDYQDNSSDLTLSEFYLLMEADLHENVSGTVSFLYEDGDTPFGVDEGFLTVQANDMWSFNLGKMYLPFGRFNTAMVNDTFALELAETNETAFVAMADLDMVDIAAYAFNGAVRDTDDDTLNSYGISFLIGSEAMNVKLDYISNLGDADAYTDLDDAEVAEVAGGYSVSAHAGMDVFTVDFEYLSALDPIGDLDQEDETTSTYGEVESIGIEFGMTVGNECECAVAVGFQSSDNAEGILPETRVSVGYMRPIFEVLTLNTEIYFDKDYDISGNADHNGDSGTGLLIDIAASF